MDSFWQDCRHALRSFAANPAFCLVVTLTLAIGIGANAVIFSVVDATLLQPLPYHDPGRLIVLTESNQGN